MKAKHIVGVLIIAVCLGVGVFSLRSSMTPYVSFKDAAESKRTVQVAGSPIKDTTKYDREAGAYTFDLKDSQNTTMPVITKENLPANFTQSTTVVAIGDYQDGKFVANRVLVKCPSKYDKKKLGKEHPGETPK